ncbi:LANO_0G03950g1_1 [Lachancea nothofagi CBS 11611]|uniref:LANO_0G03950g1_1 n=1 Tax=Lachancea nothofagi CBS 11611 TaxID=1266666 RepID=A0A1G4KFW6_9SACH|nr:LANO_0G03950g1_1 [Lachancea nothofagi CBS 11611]
MTMEEVRNNEIGGLDPKTSETTDKFYENPGVEKDIDNSGPKKMESGESEIKDTGADSESPSMLDSKSLDSGAPQSLPLPEEASSDAHIISVAENPQSMTLEQEKSGDEKTQGFSLEEEKSMDENNEDIAFEQEKSTTEDTQDTPLEQEKSMGANTQDIALQQEKSMDENMQDSAPEKEKSMDESAQDIALDQEKSVAEIAQDVALEQDNYIAENTQDMMRKQEKLIEAEPAKVQEPQEDLYDTEIFNEQAPQETESQEQEKHVQQLVETNESTEQADTAEVDMTSDSANQEDHFEQNSTTNPDEGDLLERTEGPTLSHTTGDTEEFSQAYEQSAQNTVVKKEALPLQTATIETVPNEPSELSVPQSHEIVIPSYARWFHLQKIHSIEKQSLPEFFTNRIPSKTPQVYVKYRNFMINSYRLNPNEFFTMTAARRNLCGDAGAILRLHKFLSKWGLINYQVNAKTKPTQVEPPFTGDYVTKHDAPRGLFPFESYKPAIQIPDLSRLKKLMHQIDTHNGDYTAENSVQTAGTLYQDDKKRQLEESTESPKNKSKLQRPNVLDAVDKDWTKQDVEKLLEGLQNFKSDWQKVAHYVGNKTAEQCILRFLQLPIEDAFLQSQTSDELGPLKYAPHLPFSKADNPVMSTIAFLVGLVDPEIVKKMTDRAIDSVKQENEKSILGKEHYIKEGSEIALASLGTRSHVFATNEERQMNALANEMIQTQLKKVHLKLKLLGTMEKSLEMEKKALQKQQEDVFIQRLSMAKNTNSLAAKLQQCLDDHDDKEKLQAHLNDLKDMQSKPARTSLGKGMSSTPGLEGTPRDQAQKSVDSVNDPFVKPVSVDAPQAYRYWSG